MTEKNVIRGASVPITPILSTTGEFLYDCLIKNEDLSRPLFVHEESGTFYTIYEFLQKSSDLANSLKNFGLSSTNVGVICSENNIEFFIPVLACLCTGIPLSPINPIYTDSEYAHALDLVEPDVIFCSAKSLRKILNLRKRYHKIKLVIVIDSDATYADAWSLKRFTAKYSNVDDIYKYKPEKVDIENHPAFIMFSSGTTGLPKGVVITHKNVNVKNSLQIATTPGKDPKLRLSYILGALPFFHAFGLHTCINGLIQGQTIVVLERFDFELYLRCVEKYKITYLATPPPVMQLYAKSPLMDKYDLSHVEDILVGAGPISESLEKAVKKRIPVKTIRQGYGLTEAVVSLIRVPVGTEKPGAVGKLLPNLSAVVKDLETGQNLGPNQTGELCFKGGVIMKGYYKNDAANKETFTDDGYLRTGDIGYYDEEEYFYVIDRLKELIKYKGYQVAPAELEAVLMTYPKIMDAAVVGLPDEDAGELPMAFVIKKPNVKLSESEVQQYVRTQVSPIKYLRGGVFFVVEIPRNPSGKILRRELKKMIKKYKSKL